MRQSLVPTWRAARVAAVALALAAVGLTSAGSVTAEPAQASAATAEPCLSVNPDQRVRAGTGLHGVDPNDLTPAQTAQAEQGLASRLPQRRTNGRSAALGPTTIDVYVHVITRTGGSGGVSTSRIKKQIAVLNDAYGGRTSTASTTTAFQFKLKKIDRTRKTDWYHWNSENLLDDDAAAKRKLHRGGLDDLNLYITQPSEGVLGYATFPWQRTLPKTDGVVVLNASLPGGSASGYNRGDTATHEVGHWLGLLHTFENGCTLRGDGVADTPAQADGENVFSCSATLDTCPSIGLDPVRNFLSYGDDGCLDRFTPGQAQRMALTWQAYRAPRPVL